MNENILYSPWRLNYILSEKSKSCIFCVKREETESVVPISDWLPKDTAPLTHQSQSEIGTTNEVVKTDADHFIVYRSKLCFVILNLYPYNNGHIMVVPNRHIADFSGLEKDELHDLFETVQKSEKVLKKVYNPDGINIGINLGKAAGAGIDEHLHVHLVPRWSGDVNFMTTISGFRVIPEDFSRSYQKIKEGFDNDAP